MPDIFDLIAQWWKRMLAVMVLSLLTVGIITYLKPLQYLSVTTAVPASSFASDKGKIFNENIQTLYSTLGTADDLDMILGTASLDTVYLFVADQFNLFDHYKMKEKGTAARTKAAYLLKKYTKVMKSEYGELKVKVWDTDKNLAPQLANAILEKLNSIHQALQNESSVAMLSTLQLSRGKISAELDSLTNSLMYDSVTSILRSTLISTENWRMRRIRRNSLLEQLNRYEKLINEYQLMVDSKPTVLIVVEKAKPSNWPDRPRRIQIMVATAILSFLFALLAALILERRKISA
jgi:uncharacterized protein involved in exopolysaccharide biosynthesis